MRKNISFSTRLAREIFLSSAVSVGRVKSCKPPTLAQIRLERILRIQLLSPRKLITCNTTDNDVVMPVVSRLSPAIFHNIPISPQREVVSNILNETDLPGHREMSSNEMEEMKSDRMRNRI